MGFSVTLAFHLFDLVMFGFFWTFLFSLRSDGVKLDILFLPLIGNSLDFPILLGFAKKKMRRSHLGQEFGHFQRHNCRM